MLTDFEIERIFNILMNMLHIEIGWDFALDGEIQKDISGVYLKPEEARLLFETNDKDGMIILNEEFNTDELQMNFVSTIAHECFHAYQFKNRFKNPIYLNECNEKFSMRGKDIYDEKYLNRQIEVEAYTFQNIFLHYVYDTNNIDIEVMKHLNSIRVEDAKKMIIPIIQKFHKKITGENLDITKL